ncbi:hypothetical protein DICPUDRAFT_79236 [Dictyostelium purpureum]|uniref:Uncharacterized protein n=1 Tax=Dictyostelium purpureum TaxID=5786 RepID=F0ZLZ1_DICPU|nr:uncharacterized protein DICPUDRAFT_79236 [Dictyostelium purpureum]EGC35054.1 hypothetical protein DICPUDRAFT_79236 [Dictyostelium purpureum]|eukprot:XP_003288422.1 hypothetical protein DICPUDRAFT_79236 [Dictyostelium purpureum]
MEIESGELSSSEEEFNLIYNNFINNTNKKNSNNNDRQLNNLYQSLCDGQSNNNIAFFKKLLQFSTSISSSVDDKYLDFLFYIYNKFIENKWNNKECFSEILYTLSIKSDSSNRLYSILNYSKIFNESEKDTTDFFNVLFSFVQWDNRLEVINNGIEFLGSIISISISLGFSNILNLASKWLINFKRINAPKVVKDTWGLNVGGGDIGSKEIDIHYISIKLLKYLLNDHLISNESSSNFEMLPKYSLDFTCILLTTMLSHYLNPFNRDKVNAQGKEEAEYCEYIIPKCASLISNHWLPISSNTPNDSLLFKSPFKELSTASKSPFVSHTILKELITICIFSSYPVNKNDQSLENNELIGPYLSKIISLILKSIFDGDSPMALKYKLIQSDLSIEYFNNIVTELNKDQYNTEDLSQPADTLYSIIIVLSNSFVDKSKEYSKSILQSLTKLNKPSKYSYLLDTQIKKINNK